MYRFQNLRTGCAEKANESEARDKPVPLPLSLARGARNLLCFTSLSRLAHTNF